MLLGEGFFGKVYEAVHKETGLPIDSIASDDMRSQGISRPDKLQKQAVIKEINFEDHDEDEKEQAVKDAREEARLQSLLKDSPQVWEQMLSANSKNYVIAMENGGYSLRSLLQMSSKDGQFSEIGEDAERWDRMPESMVKDIGRQALNQLVELHQQGVFHRDIKPDNILIDNGGKVSFIDFGLARQDMLAANGSYDVEFSHQPGGTVGFTSPEGLREETETLKADVFAMGMTLIEMLTGIDKFEFWDENKDTRKFESSFKKIKAVAGVTKEAKDLICKMVNNDPVKRPTAQEALAHPFFSEKNTAKGLLAISSAHRQALTKLIEAEVALEQFDVESKSGSSKTQLDLQNDVDSYRHEVKTLQAHIRVKEAENALMQERSHVDDIGKSLNVLQSKLIGGKRTRRLEHALKPLKKEFESRKALLPLYESDVRECKAVLNRLLEAKVDKG